MKVGLKILGNSTLLSAAEVVNNVCMFLRNLILARILSKADFGIAATLALVVSLFELAGKMSFGQQMTQSMEGDRPEFQKATHASQALAGALSAALIVVFSFPLSHLFGMEAHREALMLLAIIPLCTGFASLDIYRQVRHLRFTPLVLTDTVPQVIITLVAWPLAKWLQDYRAILCLLLVKAFFSLVASHLLSQRLYRLCWQPNFVLENLRFGWPLLASGFLMFGIYQGDRMLIAGTYTMSDLGVYAAAATIAMMPYLAIFRITGTISLPVMARVQTDLAKFQNYYRLFAQALALLGALFVVAMVLGGQTTIALLLGNKYREAGALLAWMAFGQAFRIIRGAPTCAALAKGDTINTMLANLFRLSGLLLAVPVALLKMDLRWIAVAGGIGEIIALGASIVRLRSRHGIHLGDCLYPLGLVIALVAAAYVIKGVFAPTGAISTLVLAALGCVVSLAAFCAVFAGLRRAAVSLIAEVWLRLKTIIKTGRLTSAASEA
jgi:O-antigen/teichoic acid export membrane protein